MGTKVEVKITFLPDGEMDVECNGRDFHVSSDGDGHWVLDEFDSSVKDADKAHVESTTWEADEFLMMLDHCSGRMEG